MKKKRAKFKIDGRIASLQIDLMINKTKKNQQCTFSTIKISSPLEPNIVEQMLMGYHQFEH